jgi:hypothetical protein
LPTKKTRKREKAVQQQENFCYFCWTPMLPASLEHDDSACLVNLDPDGAPWRRFMHWPRHVAAHVRCATDINEMRQPGKSFSLAAASA